jgi:hypothetical protein
MAWSAKPRQCSILQRSAEVRTCRLSLRTVESDPELPFFQERIASFKRFNLPRLGDEVGHSEEVNR